MKRPGTLAVLGAFGLGALGAGSAEAKSRTYAIVIAENRSVDPGVQPLRYADDDGVADWELFTVLADQAALFTVLDDDTARIHPEAAKVAEVPERAAILRRLGEWNVQMEADSARGDEPELYFVYAGHGDVDRSGMGYVSLHDGRLTRAELFKDVVAPSKARFVHLVVDACKSYFLVNARGSRKPAEGAWKDDRATGEAAGDPSLVRFLDDERGDEAAHYPRVGVIVATSGAEETHEWSRWRGGILSHELRSALYGAADVNGDGRVEYSEVRAFIAAANARVRNPEARLEIYARAPEADRHRPLSDLRRARAGSTYLHFPRGTEGRYSLEDDRGVQALDLHKEVASEFMVAVDGTRGYYLRRDELDEARIAAPAGGRAIKPRKVEVAALPFHTRALAARGALEASFRRDLFQVPFGRGFYDGYIATSGDPPVDGDGPLFSVRELRVPPDNSIAAGYVISGAPLSVPGAMHAAEVRYLRRLGRYFDLGAAAQAGHGGTNGQSVTRVAALAVVGAEYRPLSSVGLRLDLAGGYQYARGTTALGGTDQAPSVIVVGDASGARFEAGAGVAWDLVPSFGVSARGGLAVDLATVKLQGAGPSSTGANLSPFLTVSGILRL